MADFVQPTDPPSAISPGSQRSPSNPGDFLTESAGPVETLGESSPTAPIRDVAKSLAISSQNRDVQPFASVDTLDQLRNSGGASSSSSLETLADRSQEPYFVCSENIEGRDRQITPVAQALPVNDYEGDNYPQNQCCSNSPRDDDDASGNWCTSFRTVNSPERSFPVIRGSDSDDDLKPVRSTTRWGTWSSSLWPSTKQQTPKIEPSGVGAGLWNLGNTCFINSVLQCFTHTVPLIESLRSYRHPTPRNCGNEGFCVAQVLYHHIEFALRSSGDVISPDQFVDNLNYFSAYFQKCHQEDAHEFLQSLLDKLDICCSNPKKKSGSDSFEDVNIVDHVFGGRLVSRLRCCNCNSTSDMYEPSLGLSLEIEDVDSIQSALKSFTCVEKLEDQFTCDNCKEKVSKEKQLMLDKAPLVATFHLKRFKNDGISMEKIHKHVEFPLELDLRPYVLDSQNNEIGLTYHLYAFVEHLGGSLTSGHYSSYVRSASGTWHKFDDSMVTCIEESCVLSQDAYILFYARERTLWFSNVFEQIRPWLGASTSNSSPKSVLEPAYRDCVSDHSDENIDNPRPTKLSGLVEVPVISFEGSSSNELTDGASAFPRHEPGQDVFHPVDFNNDYDALMVDAFEPPEVNDLDKQCNVDSQGKPNLCLAGDRPAIDNACVPTGVQSQDRDEKLKGGTFQIQCSHLKTEKNQEKARKRPSENKVLESKMRGVALQLKKQPSSRARQFAALMNASFALSPTKGIARVGKPSKFKRKVGLHRPRPHRR